MKQHRYPSMVLATLGAMLLLIPLAAGRQDPQQEALLQKAIQIETVDGDLNAAIKLYRQIVENPGENRAVAAKALLQIGKCYEKLGSLEARKAYETLLKEYADQSDIATEARARLSALTKPAKETGIKIRQVWTGPEVDYYATPTPDGRSLVYVDWDSGGNLAIRDQADGKSRRLTDDASNGDCALESRISPDSKLIAYSWRKGPHPGYSGIDLRLIGIDGKGRRILHSEKGYDYVPLAWSADSSLLAVRRYGSSIQGTEIALVDINDSSLRILKTIPSSWPFVSFSPDNKYLAFDFPVADDSGNYDISLLALDGSGEIPLVHHPADDRLFGWIPGSQDILFSSDRSGSVDLWIAQLEDDKSHLIPEPVKRAFVSFQERLGFTNDGSYYFSIYTRRYTLQVLPIDPETGRFTIGSGTEILGSNLLSKWSPDGKQLAYIAEFENGNRRRLHVRNVGTGEEREFAHNFYAGSYCWSPDGRSILVYGNDEGEDREESRRGIFNIDVSDGSMKSVVQWPERDSLTRTLLLVHDGRSIVYKQRGCLILRDLQSGREKELYCHPNLIRSAAISPDKKTLAFGALDEQKNTIRLLLMPIDGNEPETLFEAPGNNRTEILAWTPDGKYVLFTNPENDFALLYRISRDGGDPEVLWRSTKKYPHTLSSLSFHLDGKHVAVSTYLQESEILVMENLLRQLP
jgi:Tol biopolymer transport system component